MSYQGHIILKPGKTFNSQGRRKVALCKKGPTAWDAGMSCDYHGPPMRVTVTVNGQLEFDGPFEGSSQWVKDRSGVELFVENDTEFESAMYVHVE